MAEQKMAESAMAGGKTEEGTDISALIHYIKSLHSIRDGCSQILSLAKEDRLDNFRFDEARLSDACDYVVEFIKKKYPSMDIPFHSRWRHLDAGNLGRVKSLENAYSDCSMEEKIRRKLDLAVVSVLVDAGAGMGWRYKESSTGIEYSRSEGLAVASLHMFKEGMFSSDPAVPWRVDADGLAKVGLEEFRKGFQVGDQNELVGLEGRFTLLKRLSDSLRQNPQYFGKENPRPGNMLDFLLSKSSTDCNIEDLFEVVVVGFQNVWPPSRTSIGGVNLGDVWSHSKVRLSHAGQSCNLIAFHKLSQWMTYSLLEPLQEMKLTIRNLHLMTGLPEYRNGGFFVDLKVLVPKKPEILSQPQEVDSEAIVEWRALTVMLLDMLRTMVCTALKFSPEDFPLVKLLEAGTWAAGRELAQKLRPDGGPPIAVISDGTVF